MHKLSLGGVPICWPAPTIWGGWLLVHLTNSWEIWKNRPLGVGIWYITLMACLRGGPLDWLNLCEFRCRPVATRYHQGRKEKSITMLFVYLLHMTKSHNAQRQTFSGCKLRWKEKLPGSSQWKIFVVSKYYRTTEFKCRGVLAKS